MSKTCPACSNMHDCCQVCMGSGRVSDDFVYVPPPVAPPPPPLTKEQRRAHRIAWGMVIAACAAVPAGMAADASHTGLAFGFVTVAVLGIALAFFSYLDPA